MKILMLSRSFPMPLNTGEKIRVYNIIKELSKYHEITLVTLYHEDDDLDYLPELEKICSEIYLFKSKLSKKFAAVKTLILKFPWDIIAFHNNKLKQKVNELIQSKDFDIIYIQFLSMTGNINLNLVKKSIIILDQHNADELFWRTFSEQSNNLALRIYANLNIKKLKTYQRSIYEKIQLIISVADDDARFMKKQVSSKTKVWVVPNGVDLDYFKPSNKKNSHEENIIMFCGSMDVTMNVEAALMFANEIFPLIRENMPNSRFYVVGRHPTKKVRDLAKQKNIIVTGSVDDVRPYYEKADILVAPFKLGGGTKLKILEAIAMNVPIVSTSLGCQGIKVENDIHLIIEDEMKNFSDAVIRLLKNKNERVNLANNGRRLVEEKYSWKSIIAKLNVNLVKWINKKEID